MGILKVIQDAQFYFVQRSWFLGRGSDHDHDPAKVQVLRTVTGGGAPRAARRKIVLARGARIDYAVPHALSL